jgi:NAD(P)-dependent dehydrogenase (short-subunit alcohol dehydrogenase family)
MNLAEAVAVVTGGGTGIGQAICEHLAMAGARAVVVNYSKSKDEANLTAERLATWGCAGKPYSADVRVDSDVRNMISDTLEEFGRIDILVNNAGTTQYVPYREMDRITDDVWNSILDVNLRGAFYCSRAAAEALSKSEGAIVNICSIAGQRGLGSSLPYGISKAGLLQLTRELAIALAPDVRVNSVSPGVVATEWARKRNEIGWVEDMEAKVREATPLGRVALAEDVAQAVLALVASDFVTGQDLVVDGGKSLT